MIYRTPIIGEFFRLTGWDEGCIKLITMQIIPVCVACSRLIQKSVDSLSHTGITDRVGHPSLGLITRLADPTQTVGQDWPNLHRQLNHQQVFTCCGPETFSDVCLTEFLICTQVSDWWFHKTNDNFIHVCLLASENTDGDSWHPSCPSPSPSPSPPLSHPPGHQSVTIHRPDFILMTTLYTFVSPPSINKTMPSAMRSSWTIHSVHISDWPQVSLPGRTDGQTV